MDMLSLTRQHVGIVGKAVEQENRGGATYHRFLIQYGVSVLPF